ncbi:putative C6 transcription factor [Aspergillus thermomutatus]|uniref:Transcription factor domain-containing protein n=1 Tax=Aspergillus thermomutatus TaxID=41047 RepID=A0A397G9Q0_ASPTH|nr:uncharacterized protein CDV56_101126 [Aspergillus thermomutatus]RHZ46116.1 hypothetical protein CDV56_101126 [Aspergillus thermomutatus]
MLHCIVIVIVSIPVPPLSSPDGLIRTFGAEASDGVLPCSHCLRTKKTCSLNPHWIQLHPPSTVQRLKNPEDSNPDNGQRQVKRQRLQPRNKESLESATVNNMTSLDSLVQLLQASPQGSDVLGWDRLYAPGDPPSITDSNQSGATQGQQELESLENLEELSSVASRDNHPADPTLHIGWNGFANPEMTGCGSDSSNVNVQSVISGLSQGNLIYRSPMSSTPSQWGDSQTGWRRKDRQRNDSMNMRDHHALSLSTFGADHLIMENSNKILISDSLLQIYHDVLENNLACWLAEDTCPYRLQWRRREPLPIPQNPIPGTQTHPEWGVAWSNRMFHRIRQLDRSAQSAKLIRLTSYENRASSKVLNLAVMAFSTQWAQGKRRWDGFHGASRCENFMDHEGEELGDEFEQALQQSIWEQARRALQNVSDLECFRVVFAELIFGLVQKPYSRNEYDLDATIGSATRNLCKSVTSSILPKIADIFVREGPPIFMERAARKIHALKYRFEAYQAGFRQGARSCESEPNAEVPQGMSAEDGQTIGLLYWLAVMFDTVSSSINERPVVVPDEECQHDGAQRAAKGPIEIPVTNVRWKLDLYAQDDTERPSLLHWPCPYEVATRAVARSAAVKVLLFRHISYLQNGLRNCENGPAIEEIIKTTLSVYRYWDVTHGAFFRDLIMNYESVPPRIRSWFPCISIPWHLGSLMLANLIDFVDENRLGCDGYRAKRLHVGLAAKIRRASSIELAQFAAVITPQAVGTIGLKQLPDFHFAVSESPALTEPWTILLIRAFTNAAVFHMSEIEELQNHQWFDIDHTSEALQVSTARAESCIRALRFLGSKSRMAEAIGKVLSKHLDT